MTAQQAPPAARVRRELHRLRLYATFTYPFACVPFLYFYFADRGVSTPAYGALISTYYVTMVAAEVPTGLLADRFGKRAALLLGPLVLAAGFWTIALVPTYAGFMVAEVLLGLGHSILSGPPSALLFELLAGERRAADYRGQESVNNTFRLAGTGASFLAGGAVVALADIRTAILLTGALCCVASATALTVSEPRRAAASAATTPRLRVMLRDAARDLRLAPVAWMLGYYVVLFFLLRFPFHTYQPFLRAAGHEAPWTVGLLFFALNAVAAPFSRLTPWFASRFGTGVVLWAMPVVLGASMVLMAGSVDVFGIALFFLHQVPFGMHMAVVQDFVHHRIGDAARATVLSVLSFAGRLAFAAGFPLVLALPSIGASYAAVGGGGLLATLLIMLLGRRHLPRRGG